MTTPLPTAEKQPGPRPALRFVVPTYGRLSTAQACLRQLGRTCRTLADAGLDASAVVVGNDQSLIEAEKQDFRCVVQKNHPLGSKWNDGFEQAARDGADYFVPMGSDDWVDPDIFTVLPRGRQVICFKRAAIVAPTGDRMALLKIPYRGGIGIKIFMRKMLAQVEFRPAIESRNRAIDSSIMRRLAAPSRTAPGMVYQDRHPLQIVDWKTGGPQLNTYEACLPYAVEEVEDPWKVLAGFYPNDALADMHAIYEEAAA